MNIYHYFTHQKNTHLSDQKKAELFKRICQKRLQQRVMRRHVFSYKKISYTLMAVTLVLLTFGSMMIDKQIDINNLFFSSSKGNISSVYAGYIAEIIEFNGEYIIQNGDKTLSSQYIHNGDIIFLKTGSEMIFTLDDHSQAKIIGPAEFSIAKSKQNTYKIILVQGNFFKIFNETVNQDIEIIADDISIQANKYQTLDLQIAKEGKEVMIKNNGGTTKLTTPKNNTTSKDTLTKEIISIKNNDINTITDETFTNFLSRNNISETLSLSHPSKPLMTGNLVAQNTTPFQKNSGEFLALPPSLPEDISLVSERMFLDYDSLSGQLLTGEIDETIKSALGIENEINLPSPDQDQILKNSLNSFFLMNNLEKIYLALLEHNPEKAEGTIKDLSTKMNTLAKTFDEEDQSEATLASIQTFALALQTRLATTYYIAPSYLTQLEKIANRCAYLATLSSEKTTPDEAQTQRETFITSLPEELQLK
jgi:hypothetical protein